MARFLSKTLACLGALAALFMSPSWALGQTSPALPPPSSLSQTSRSQSAVPTPQELNPASAAPKQAHKNDIFIAPEPGPCPLRDSSLTFVLKKVEFVGADGVKASKLLPSYDGLIGQRVPVWTVCDIRDRATAALFAAGILARVEIPSQRIADGQLQLEVIEARIVSIHFHGDAGPAEAKVEDYLEHLRGLIPFDLNIAQRYLLLASEVPGVQISAAIRPSPQGRGAVDLEVTATRKMLDAAVNVQNLGSRTLGPWGGLARVDFNGLTPFGDRTSMVLYSTPDGREQQVAQLMEEFRPGDSGLVARASLSYSLTKPGGDLAPEKLDGDAIDAQFSLAYPLIRKQRENLSLVGGFEYVNEQTDLASTTVLFDDRLRILFAQIQTDARGTLWGRPWAVGGDLELRKGLNILNASPLGESTLSITGANPNAFVQRLAGHATLDPAPWIELYGAATAQNADSSLLTYEELAIGNLTYGRGYDPSSVAGDRGVAGTAELRVGPFTPAPRLVVQGYVFFDAAYAKRIGVSPLGSTVRSTGGGLRFSYDSRFNLDIAYADPLDRINNLAARPPPARALVTMSASY